MTEEAFAEKLDGIDNRINDYNKHLGHYTFYIALFAGLLTTILGLKGYIDYSRLSEWKGDIGATQTRQANEYREYETAVEKKIKYLDAEVKRAMVEMKDDVRMTMGVYKKPMELALFVERDVPLQGATKRGTIKDHFEWNIEDEKYELVERDLRVQFAIKNIGEQYDYIHALKLYASSPIELDSRNIEQPGFDTYDTDSYAREKKMAYPGGFMRWYSEDFDMEVDETILSTTFKGKHSVLLRIYFGEGGIVTVPFMLDITHLEERYYGKEEKGERDRKIERLL